MPEEENVTQADLESFAEKLTEWGQNLSAGEQALLNVVLARAGAESTEVEGFQFDMGFGVSAKSFLAPLVASNAIGVEPTPVPKWLDIGPSWPQSSPPSPKKFA